MCESRSSLIYRFLSFYGFRIVDKLPGLVWLTRLKDFTDQDQARTSRTHDSRSSTCCSSFSSYIIIYRRSSFLFISRFVTYFRGLKKLLPKLAPIHVSRAIYLYIYK